MGRLLSRSRDWRLNRVLIPLWPACDAFSTWHGRRHVTTWLRSSIIVHRRPRAQRVTSRKSPRRVDVATRELNHYSPPPSERWTYCHLRCHPNAHEVYLRIKWTVTSECFHSNCYYESTRIVRAFTVDSVLFLAVYEPPSQSINPAISQSCLNSKVRPNSKLRNIRLT